MKLIILTRISLDDPTGYTDFKFYPCDTGEVADKVKKIKNRVIKTNVEEFRESNDTKCPYKIGYFAPEFREGSRNLDTRICRNLSLLEDGDVFLIEEHSSYSFAFGITVKNLIDDESFVLYEH